MLKDNDDNDTGKVSKNSRKITNNLKTVMSDLKKQKESSQTLGRESKKLYKSNKLFDVDKSKQKRFD